MMTNNAEYYVIRKQSKEREITPEDGRKDYVLYFQFYFFNK